MCVSLTQHAKTGGLLCCALLLPVYQDRLPTLRSENRSDSSSSVQVTEMVRCGPESAGGIWVSESVVIVAGLLLVQFMVGSFSVVVSGILATGVEPLFFVFASNLAIFLFLLPFAVAIERKQWPATLTPKLAFRLVLLSIGGVTAFQALLLMGIKKTSPTIAAAMSNLSPGLIFIIASCLGFEKLDMRCRYSKAKILGTLMCLAGVMSMTLLQNSTSSSPTKVAAMNRDWIVGCIYLISASCIISFSVVLQASVMRDFDAPISLAAVTALIGAVLTPVVQWFLYGRVDVGDTTSSVKTIAIYIILGGLASAICVSIQTWSLKKSGPVMVSVFSPVQTVCSAVLSAVTLGKFLSWQSMVGILVMFIGLYVVLWAKNMEIAIIMSSEDDVKKAEDIEKPLLHEVV